MLHSRGTIKDTMKNLKPLIIVLAGVIALVLFGCSTMYKFPQCNEKYAQESFLAKIANKYEVCLQDVARNTSMVSMVAVGVKPEIARDARIAAEGIVAALNNPLTDIAFKDMLRHQGIRAAILVDLIELNGDYLAEFNTGQPLDKDSRLMLQEYFANDFIPRLKRYELLLEESVDDTFPMEWQEVTPAKCTDCVINLVPNIS